MMAPTSASPLPEDLVEPSSGTGFQASAESIKLIALDVDGTLLNSQGIIPEANSDAIAQARQRGVRVILATGRAFLSTAAVARQLDLDTPLICANGALIKDLKGIEWWSRGIDLHLAREIAAWADAGRHALVTLVGDQSYYAWPSSVAEADWQPWPDERVVDNSASTLTAPPLRIIAVGDETCRALLGRFSHEVKGKVRFDRYERDGRLVAVVAVHAAVSKERALDLLCARWGLGAAQAMALGDSSVDLGMLRWAGIGVAMSNAPVQMREGVEWVAPSNDEAGVAWAIERFVLDDSATP